MNTSLKLLLLYGLVVALMSLAAVPLVVWRIAKVVLSAIPPLRKVHEALLILGYALFPLQLCTVFLAFSGLFGDGTTSLFRNVTPIVLWLVPIIQVLVFAGWMCLRVSCPSLNVGEKPSVLLALPILIPLAFGLAALLLLLFGISRTGPSAMAAPVTTDPGLSPAHAEPCSTVVPPSPAGNATASRAEKLKIAVEAQNVPISQSVVDYVRNSLADPQYDWKQPINFYGKVVDENSATQPVFSNAPLQPPSSAVKRPSNGFEQWLQSVQPPIEFYGKVVDENERPVEGAAVEFLWTHLHPEADFKTNSSSDVNGFFSLAGVNGAGLEVNITKPGYYPIRRMNQNTFNYVRLPGGCPFTPDLSSPVVFHLRKRGPGTKLITSQYGFSPDLELVAPRSGSPVRVDLLQRKVVSGGQLEISQTKPEYMEGKNATAWSFRMMIPSGGFVEQNDEFPFEAPESGYQPLVEFRFSKAETNWTTSLKKSFFITFGQPPRYGWLTLETDMGWGGARLRYAINPDGSRCLEPRQP